MDWARAIAINRAALTRIVAALIAMVGLAGDGMAARLKRPTYRAALKVLHPAEAAVRRLIIIAAPGLKAKLPPPRPMPAGLAIAGKGGGRRSFQLFDTRKRFGRRNHKRVFAKVRPRILFFDSGPLVPLFHRQPAPIDLPEPDDTVDARRLGRRLAAVKLALADLPRQARRLARWRARRDREGASFASPLRIGHPPGYRKEPRDEIDWVLRECHGLARDALALDTS